MTNYRPEGNKDREYSPQPDSSPGYQEEVLMVRIIERGEKRAMAARNKDAADMQAWRRAESETDARKTTS